MSTRDRQIEALLPLPRATFHILVSLGESERHGYGIIQDVARRTGGRLELSAGTLYRSIQRMQDQGLIVEVKGRGRPAPAEERRRYYRVTAFGARVARAEAARMAELVELARASGFAPEGA